MKKNDKIQAERKALIELAINNPKKAAKYFEHAALSLKQANNTNQVIEVLANTLFLSPKTLLVQLEKTA